MKSPVIFLALVAVAACVVWYKATHPTVVVVTRGQEFTLSEVQPGPALPTPDELSEVEKDRIARDVRRAFNELRRVNGR